MLRRCQPLKEPPQRIDGHFRQVENSTLHPTPIDEAPLIIRYRGQEQGTLVIRFIADLFIAEFCHAKGFSGRSTSRAGDGLKKPT